MDMWSYDCLAFVLYAFLQYVFIGLIRVWVKILLQGGNTLAIYLYTMDTVRKLKELIEEKEGMQRDQYSLYLAHIGKPLLTEELTIDDFG